jgi:hypothetical protein
MKPLVATNIRQSFTAFDVCEGEKPPVTGDISQLIDEFVQSDRAPSFHLTDSGVIDSPDRDRFGFFALTHSLRAMLIGTRFLQAGDVLVGQDFCASAVVCYYTSALNVTLAYLALQGRAFVDKPRGPRRSPPVPGEPLYHDLWSDRSSILAILSRRNSWSFEKRGESHLDRWRELERVHKEEKELPQGFLDLFDYALSYGPESCWDRAPEGRSEGAFIRDGIRAVTSMRHDAVYRGYGYDDFAVDLILNGEGGAGLDLKPRALRDFAVVQGQEVLSDLSALVSSIGEPRWSQSLPRTYMSVFTPDVIEVGESEVTGAPDYTRSLKEVMARLSRQT